MKPSLLALSIVTTICGMQTTSHAAAPDSATDRDTNLGNGTLDEDILGLSSRHSPIIIDERELLRRYLQEVERRSALEIASELAKVDFARDVFRAHDARWWAIYNDTKQIRERKQRIAEYWAEFNRGQNWAQSVLGSTPGNNNCKAVVNQLPQVTHPTDSVLTEAFRRGAVAGAPECFIADLNVSLKTLASSLNDLNKRLLSAQKRLSFESPNDDKLAELSDLFRDSVIKIIKETTLKNQPRLEQLKVRVSEKIVALKPQADMLATLVGCQTKPQCALRLEAPKKTLTAGASYQILGGDIAMTTYVSSISVIGLMRAVSKYVEVNPHDRDLVMAQKSALERAVEDVDLDLGAQVAALQFDFKDETSRMVRDFTRKNAALFRSFFSVEERIALIDYMTELKTAFHQYKTFELGTRIESKIWDSLSSDYALALERAARMSLSTQLPTQRIVVSWDDEPATRYVVNVAWPKMASGYLLGDNAQDVKTWVDFLEL